MDSITVGQLQIGDIFSFGPNVWDTQYKLHEIEFFYNDHWVDNYTSNCRICFWLSYIYGNGAFRGMFKWSDTNSLEQVVYIPKYSLSTWKRLKGQYVYIISNQQYPFGYKLNEINKL